MAGFVRPGFVTPGNFCSVVWPHDIANALFLAEAQLRANALLGSLTWVDS